MGFDAADDVPSAPAKAEPPAAPKKEAAAPPPPPAAPLTSLKGKRVYVVDAHSLIFQVFHVMPDMSSPSGEPTGAIFGFTRDVFDLLEHRKPDYLFVAFDVSEHTFRSELYADYKAHRDEMPTDLRPQIPHIRRVLDALGVAVVEKEGFEADDVLATIARVVEELEGECYLVTSDKDCRQLITDRVKMFNPRKGQVLDAAALMADWGVRPEQVVDFQSLVGDSVDNVPGVPLIGPKIASQLLQQYGTLEEVLNHAAEVKGRKRSENLITYREQALLSRQLVRLDANVPVEIDWSAGRVGGVDRQRTLDLFQEFGFRRLGERLDAPAPEEIPPPVEWVADYRVVKSLEELDQLVAELARQEYISIDTETTSISPRAAQVAGYALAWKAGEAWYVPVRGPECDGCLDPHQTLNRLAPVFENPAIKKIGQNLKYDMGVLRAAGRRLAGVAFDTMVADYLLEAGEQNHGLDDLARRYLNHVTSKIEDVIGSGKNQRRMDESPVAAVAPYAAEDADVPLRLWTILREKLEADELTELFETVEMPLIEVLVELEHTGVKIDTAHLKSLSEEYARRMATLEKEIHEMVGREFNIGSTKQLAEILFTDLKLPVVRRNKTGASTNVDVLEQLARVHPLPAKIVEYRQYAKLKSTYIDALPELVLPETGRVHTSFNQVVAATGRLSSNEPNLQNIPIRTDVGREIRTAFIPGEPGWRLVAADYSQIELRVLAHYSGDAALAAAFANDEDIHARVASEVFGVPLDEVSPDMRRTAKAVNFGVIYGQSPFGLAKTLGIERSEAARFIDAYFARYPGVTEFMEKILEDCRRTGYVKTILGRRRRISGIRGRASRAGAYQRNLPERTAINTVIQGSAADLIKLAMLGIHRRLTRDSFSARMLLQIHDELLFEAPVDEVEPLAGMVVEEMSAVHPLSIPLGVDVKSGENWGRMGISGVELKY
ncbi:MAG: DNA polymerase I [Planctomycetes bacterium]|nr:DNA polymerase I [Planctomycetota bacterium]